MIISDSCESGCCPMIPGMGGGGMPPGFFPNSSLRPSPPAPHPGSQPSPHGPQAQLMGTGQPFIGPWYSGGPRSGVRMGMGNDFNGPPGWCYSICSWTIRFEGPAVVTWMREACVFGNWHFGEMVCNINGIELRKDSILFIYLFAIIQGTFMLVGLTIVNNSTCIVIYKLHANIR